MDFKLVLMGAVVLGVVSLILLRALGGTETQELGAPLPLPPTKGLSTLWIAGTTSERMPTHPRSGGHPGVSSSPRHWFGDH